jgi:hypothetical protein
MLVTSCCPIEVDTCVSEKSHLRSITVAVLSLTYRTTIILLLARKNCLLKSYKVHRRMCTHCCVYVVLCWQSALSRVKGVVSTKRTQKPQKKIGNPLIHLSGVHTERYFTELSEKGEQHVFPSSGGKKKGIIMSEFVQNVSLPLDIHRLFRVKDTHKTYMPRMQC